MFRTFSKLPKVLYFLKMLMNILYLVLIVIFLCMSLSPFSEHLSHRRKPLFLLVANKEDWTVRVVTNLKRFTKKILKMIYKSQRLCLNNIIILVFICIIDQCFFERNALWNNKLNTSITKIKFVYTQFSYVLSRCTH